MSFQKLLLASVIAAASTASYAMEAMDDSAMSATTGQDGLTIDLSTDLSLNMYIHDTDGFTGATDSGAIGIKNIVMSSDGAGGNVGIRILIDAGADVATATAPVLQVGVSTTTTTVLALGNLTVANSNRTAVGGSWGVTSETGTLMNLGTLTIAPTSNLLNIQMGNELQGSWMRLATSFTGGININSFSINDAGGGVSGGGISGNLQIVDTGGGANLTATLGIDASATGLVIGVTQLGTAAGGVDVRLADLKLGAAATTPIGDVEIIGLNLNGSTITVSGH